MNKSVKNEVSLPSSSGSVDMILHRVSKAYPRISASFLLTQNKYSYNSYIIQTKILSQQCIFLNKSKKFSGHNQYFKVAHKYVWAVLSSNCP